MCVFKQIVVRWLQNSVFLFNRCDFKKNVEKYERWDVEVP